MTDVFVSYSHKDKARVQKLVDHLSQVPLSVWWDKELRREEFSSEIEGKIKQADRVLVAWSKNSKMSIWVRGEALKGLSQNKLVQILLDGEELPIPFNAVHAIKLSDWTGDPSDDGVRIVVEALGGDVSNPNARQILQAGASRSQLTALWLAPASLAFLLVAAAWIQFGPPLPHGAPSREHLMLGIGGAIALCIGVTTAMLIRSSIYAFRND